MRPRLTCHMATSLDGRLLPARWSDPEDAEIGALVARYYEDLSDRLGADGWIVGRRTMAEFAREDRGRALLDTPRNRANHIARVDPDGLCVAIDPSGRLGYAGGTVEGDHVVAVLSSRATDARLDALRADGASYVFAGPQGDDLDAALSAIGEEFGVRSLVLQGGGHTNGAFLAAGLIDEVSTLVLPAIDGLCGVPAIFEHAAPAGTRPAAGQRLRLVACEVLDGGAVWLRHAVRRDDPPSGDGTAS